MILVGCGRLVFPTKQYYYLTVLSDKIYITNSPKTWNILNYDASTELLLRKQDFKDCAIECEIQTYVTINILLN